MKKYLCLGNKKQKSAKRMNFYVRFLSFNNDIRASVTVTVKIQSIKQ